ncbi:MAG: hypothetical protein LBL62_02480 [Planctomycetaceae bacterium]|jgi:hypothetical protein|nr:hypothetical protein [Planctomycetaceae bacterium]
MSNPIQQSPRSSIRVPHKVTVPVNQSLNQKQNDRKVSFILTTTILLFLLLLLLLFLSYMLWSSGNSGQSEHSGLPVSDTVSGNGTDADGNGNGNDFNTGTANGNEITSDQDEQITESNSGEDTETTTMSQVEELSEKNNYKNIKQTAKNSSQNSQEAATDTKSIEPDKTTPGDKLAEKFNDQEDTANNTNFSLIQHDATLRIFGTVGKGSSFVFVFDRSGSMLGKPLHTAQLELTQALGFLNQKHRFNIIFYDDEKLIWKKGLATATQKNKSSAIKFIEGISAGGKTKPLPALLEAILYKPDVIFFLTDGEFDLNLDDVCEKIGKTKINVIHFGSNTSRSTLLQNLAERAKGDYRYININQLDKL